MENAMDKVNKEALIDYWNLVQSHVCPVGHVRAVLWEREVNRILENPRDRDIYLRGSQMIRSILDSVIKKHSDLTRSKGFNGSSELFITKEFIEEDWDAPLSRGIKVRKASLKPNIYLDLKKPLTAQQIERLFSDVATAFSQYGFPIRSGDTNRTYYGVLRSGDLRYEERSLIYRFMPDLSLIHGVIVYAPIECSNTSRFLKKTVPIGDPTYLTQVGHKVIFVPKSFIPTITHHPRSDTESLNDIREGIQKANPHQAVTDEELRIMTSYLDDGVSFVPFDN